MKKNFLWALFALAVGSFVVAQSGLSLAEKADVRDESVQGSIAVPGSEVMLASMAKVSLVEAVQAALKSVSGKAIAAELEEDEGFLVYSVDVVNDGKVTEVKVDAGNKKILKTEMQDEDGKENGEDEGESCGHGKRGKCGGHEKEDE